MNNNKKLLILIFIFGISGFSGLIYQSIWASYLKLFLGHSAYAQTLVLAIFMGGMAVGAWFVGKQTSNLKRPILWYAIVEALVGVFGIVFHDVYISVTDFSFDYVIGNLSSTGLVPIYKWSLAATLILPQSILLGATFPLLAAGLVRITNNSQGRMVSWLYFSNSLGAVVGVLTSGFILIHTYGLPGTVVIAGFVNLWLAALVWVLNKRWDLDSMGYQLIRIVEPGSNTKEIEGRPQLIRLMIVCAAFTGMASFFYELGWIRMLSMVLGSSSHSFELMLSGFILGIALGGFWIKNRIESFTDPVKVLAYIQLTMGVLAALSLLVYDKTFIMMSILYHALDFSESGYLFFNFSSHVIVLLLMLPTTICAGMTLPLITFSLMKTRMGEKGIGLVYSANTLGSIAGILIVVHLIMPLLGLKTVILLGAFIDIVIGCFLLGRRLLTFKVPTFYIPAAAASLVVIIAGILFQLDPKKTSSSVYRNGSYSIDVDSVAHWDGKTSSIDVFTVGEGEEKRMVIATNGKPDASITMNEQGDTSPDEITMIMAGVLPLVMHDAPQHVANIGIGSGLTGHTLMGDPRVKSLDSIEIEQKMVLGAKQFGNKVERSFTDPRSKIFIEDAKTYFSSQDKKYDVVISEPSNPWVSGVASLFSSEFYTHVNHYLDEDGIFVQWLHLYETDYVTVASVMKALGEKFNYYNVYTSNTVDMLIVASQSFDAIQIDYDIFQEYEDPALLQRVGLANLNDVKFHYLASKRVLAPFFDSFDVKPNSDFYPVIDSRAVKARFMKSDARGFATLYNSAFDLEKIWPGNEPIFSDEDSIIMSDSKHFFPSKEAEIAKAVQEFLYNNSTLSGVPDDIYFAANLFKSDSVCHSHLSENFVVFNLGIISSAILPYWNKDSIESFSDDVVNLPCAEVSEDVLAFAQLLSALVNDQYEQTQRLSSQLLDNHISLDRDHTKTSVMLLSVNMYSLYMMGEYPSVTNIFDKFKEMSLNLESIAGAMSLPVLYHSAKQELVEKPGIANN
ncbi:hypothetical protein [Marinibactrum halimedae]|uniref:Spermidine synthase n=1 Tax=Marinibactrum halimedae TaxID=1444977 RepID=A0AA37T844_9GAMM|nr:hypothetical protein [Marinibactrum halimedae]MCD9460299.1 hypothetical protein [Marinibactrum halimedae]GLS24387.1 hypothetical protein GCM10007877_00980 [Marinibactrum halimedae]